MISANLWRENILESRGNSSLFDSRTYDSTNNTYAYPISETKGTDIQLTTSATYDFYTGLVRTTTDANNQVTNYEYEPDTMRQKKITYPKGAFTQTEYSDKLITTASQLSAGFVRMTITLDTNKTVQSYSYFDGRRASIRSAAQTPDGWSISAMRVFTDIWKFQTYWICKLIAPNYNAIIVIFSIIFR